MDRDKLLNGLAVFSSGYVKRWTEGVYDSAFETQLGRRLQELPKPAKYGIEASLNLLAAFFDQKLAQDTPLKRIIGELGRDAAPEIAKRLLADARDEILAQARSPQEEDIAKTLLDLEPAALVALLDWLYSVDESSRAQLVEAFGRLTTEHVTKLVDLTPEEREKFLRLLSSATTPTVGVAANIGSALEEFERRWSAWLDRRQRKVGGRGA